MLIFEWQKGLSVVISIFWSNVCYFIYGYSMTPFQFYFLSDLAGSVFSPNEVWQHSIYWMFQKHSYKNTVIYPSLCRTSRGYQGLSVVILFFFWTHSFHLGKKGCVCVSLYPGCQICVHVSIFDFWMPSLYTSALQEWSKNYKCLGLSFPVCLHICACAWALSVCSHILYVS